MTSVRGAEFERAPIGDDQPSLTVILFILTGVMGRSPGLLRGTFEIASTTSMPAMTLPNTGSLEFPGQNTSRKSLCTVLMKNWLLPVFGPAFAIDSVPRSLEILGFGGCSSLMRPSGLSPVPARGLFGSLLCGQPNWTMKLSITRWKWRPSYKPLWASLTNFAAGVVISSVDSAA